MNVCVLMAVYNGGEWLEQQLDSILKQTNVILDIFISLDRSNDNSLLIIERYVELNANIHLLPSGDKYGSAGQNFFRLLKDVDFGRYDFISFADQDDIWLENKLEKSINLIHATDSDAYSGNVTAFWSSGRRQLVTKDHNQADFDYLFESAGPGCTFVISKALCLDIQRDLTNKWSHVKSLWLHDWYCYSYARSKGFKWIIGKEPLMLYRQHELNQVGANSGFKALVARAQVVLSGDAFDKVLSQSDFIGLDAAPLKLLKENTFISIFKLSFYSRRCRRSLRDAVLFYIAVNLLSLKRLITK